MASPEYTYPGPARAESHAPGAPTRRSGKGPVWLVVAGALVLVATVALAVVVARMFVGALPTDVLGAGGTPGPAAVAAAPAPGETAAELDADTRYAVYLVAPHGQGTAALTGPVGLVSPSGTAIAADRSPGVSSTASRGGVTARTVGAFRSADAGTYTVTVPAGSVDGLSVVVTPDTDTGAFLGGVFGTVAGVFAVIGLAVVGAGLLVGGLVWRVLRSRAQPTPPR